MKILLTMIANYLSPSGGMLKSNRAWLEQFAAAGHTCRAVTFMLAKSTQYTAQQIQRELIGAGAPPDVEIAGDGGVSIFPLNGVGVHAVSDAARVPSYLIEQIREFEPDWVLVSCEDPHQILLTAALQHCPGRVIYVALTPQTLPFGPSSISPNPAQIALLRQAAAVVTLGAHMADYIQQYTDLTPAVIHPPIYGDPPFAHYGRFDQGAITLVNPCVVKGLPILLDLARAYPAYPFAALPGWGTTAADRKALEALPNMRVLAPCRNIDDVLSHTRVLLAPSLWQEGFGLIVVEAMLRGIPVLASNFGGLVDAKLGTQFLLPVRPIERFEARFDGAGLPIPVVPDQDLRLWSVALRRLLSDRALYEYVAAESRAVALAFVSSTRRATFERFLRQLVPQTEAAPALAGNRQMKVDPIGEQLGRLSPEKRALLALRLEQKRRA